jgi:hypothetical protein
MALLGKALLAVWNEVAPDDETDFAGWYMREHIPERTSVPGMKRGRKYRAIDGGSPANMALYEALTLDVLTSGAYRTQLANPTEWTKRVTSRFSFMRRAICDVIADAGQGVGGFATALHFAPAVGAEAGLKAWAERMVTDLASMPQVSGAHVWVAAQNEPTTPTSRLSAQAQAANPAVSWVLGIEAASLSALDAARAAVTAADPAARGAADLVWYPRYQLQFVLERS